MYKKLMILFLKKKNLLFINVFNIFQLYSLHACSLDIYITTLNLLTHFNLYNSFTSSLTNCHTSQKSIYIYIYKVIGVKRLVGGRVLYMF